MTLSRKARLERKLASIRAKKDDALKLAGRLGREEERRREAVRDKARRYRARKKAKRADSG